MKVLKVQMSGSLRQDLFDWLLEWEGRQRRRRPPRILRPPRIHLTSVFLDQVDSTFCST